MVTNASAPQRLYLMQVSTVTAGPFTVPTPCYLIQTGDGKNILIDTGYPPNFQHTPSDPIRPPGSVKIVYGKNVIEQLAMIDVQPADVDMLISSHFDPDHAGNLAAFPNARLIAQRRQYEVARAGDPRFALTRSQWDQPLARYQLVDGDTQLLPGLELIETSGHVPGNQSVLLHLPHTGLVLLPIDAIARQADLTADRAASPMDADAASVIASTHKLLALIERQHPSLIIFEHDAAQWATLKRLPDYYN